ncbi:MAG: T9SS type A sorting domain-containing protein [Bacteroidales bacterium]
MINAFQNNDGFKIKIITEVEYCRMIFASSDHPNTDLIPILSIQYDTTQTNTEYTKIEDLNISIYPNPTNDVVMIKIDTLAQKGIYQATISNIQGQLIKQVELTDQKTSFNTKALQRGVYFLKLTRDNEILKVEQLIIQKSGFT